MSVPVPQELNTQPQIPSAYVSGFTFFQESAQKDMSELTAKELAILIGRWPRSAGRFVHELWRTGRMEVLYQFFTLPDKYRPEDIREEDVIVETAIMVKRGGVSLAEVNSFITDLTIISQNAHDNQSFGDEPLDQEAIREKVQRVMLAAEDTIPWLP